MFGLLSILKNLEATTEVEPIEFELVDPAPPPKRSNEIIETPDEAKIDAPSPNAKYASDKNTQAQDLYENKDLPTGESYSNGISKYHLFAGGGMPQEVNQSQKQENEGTEGEQSRNQENNKGEFAQTQEGDIDLGSVQRQSSRTSRFTKELLSGKGNIQNQHTQAFSDDADWKNIDTNADVLGGISLSAYDWDFAPYILYLKKRIRQHLYPPAAFYRMGMISGEVTIKFRIHPDGTLSDVEVVSTKGHKAFVPPSENSIIASSPFRPLPDSFKHPFLDITSTFMFNIY